LPGKSSAIEKANQAEKGERINRYLARCGLCSRREADRWIMQGRVRINGQCVEKPGVGVKSMDQVMVDNKPVRPLVEQTYLAYHKPRGLLCSRRDDRGRPLIYEHLDVSPNVQSIGRLDMDSEGLLLLSDDGSMARALTKPSAHLPRIYRARLTGNLSMETLDGLRHGGRDIGKDEVSAPWDVLVDAETRGHSWLRITIHRGRWREIRRTLESYGHTVRRLIRVQFGPIKLGDLTPGTWRNLSDREVSQLKSQYKL